MVEHLNEFLESEEKIVVFGWFVDTQRDLVVQYPHAVHALGKDSDAARNEAIDKFQTDPNTKMLIASLKAIGIGVNLTAAHYVAFAELGWTPADMDQATDRLDRIGQTLPVSTIYYIGVGSVEEEIVKIIDTKRRIVGVATDGLSATGEDIRKTLIGRLLRKYSKSE
jgi:SNF2 family DNA or RNA helicase